MNSDESQQEIVPARLTYAREPWIEPEVCQLDVRETENSWGTGGDVISGYPDSSAS